MIYKTFKLKIIKYMNPRKSNYHEAKMLETDQFVE